MSSETTTMYLVSVTKNVEKNGYSTDRDDLNGVFVRQSYDVICDGLPFDCGMRMLTPPHHTSALLQKVVNEFLAQHHVYMTEALTGLSLYCDNIISVYTSIASEIVRTGNNSTLTWGRVVLLFALGKRMAQICFQEPSPTVQTFIVHVAHFIESKTGPWIESQGGWDSIYNVFGSNHVQSSHSVIQGYFHTVLGYIIKAFEYSNPIPFELLKF